MTLTEQWKKGELEEGWYYVKNVDGVIGMLHHSKISGWYNVHQVLAPVPSYEEWKSTGKFAMEAMNVAEERQRLKELLKECRDILEDISEHTDYNEVGVENLLTKIDNQ